MKEYPKALFLVSLMLLLATTASRAQKATAFNRDSTTSITKLVFDQLVDESATLLATKELSEISDTAHRNMMMCLNTLMMAHDSTFKKRFLGGRYERLEQMARDKEYSKEVIKVYPEWIPNRGMGFYFPKLRMELYGTPSLYAWFRVTD